MSHFKFSLGTPWHLNLISSFLHTEVVTRLKPWLLVVNRRQPSVLKSGFLLMDLWLHSSSPLIIPTAAEDCCLLYTNMSYWDSHWHWWCCNSGGTVSILDVSAFIKMVWYRGLIVTRDILILQASFAAHVTPSVAVCFSWTQIKDTKSRSCFFCGVTDWSFVSPTWETANNEHCARYPSDEKYGWWFRCLEPLTEPLTIKLKKYVFLITVPNAYVCYTEVRERLWL